MTLTKHYNDNHNKTVTISHKIFQKEEEFDIWKIQIEKSCMAKYICKRSALLAQKRTVHYHYCNRSGQRRVIANPKRSRKSQGSCKINIYCTSFMTVSRDVEKNLITVDYCLDHIGHSTDLGHPQAFQKKLRSDVAGKLSQGIEPAKVLDMIREDIFTIDRDSLVTQKDIHNIKNQYNISKAHKYRDDGLSVDMWMKQLSEEEDNPILFYKPQHGKHTTLQDDDFLLCIQTKFQREMMLRHGSKIICAHSTHCTTQYDFYLISLLTIDEYQEAIPMGYI